MMQTLDLSKMAMMGQMPGAVGVMPGGQIMGMPQMMQMGMGGMGGMGGMPGMTGMTGMGGMMGASGMPQGIMMNPLMAMQKPNT
jgi:suppressor of tumorigenicity protein 13